MKDNINYKAKLGKLKAFFFDIDGVLTDGTVSVLQEGPIRTMNVKDGYALQYAVKKGFLIAIISGGAGTGLHKRFDGLGIKEVHTQVENKIEKYRELLKKHNLKNEEVLYMGDDIPDFLIMKEVGVSCCPNDACTDILEIAEYVSPIKGGRGCAREIIEQTMKAQNKWELLQHSALW